MKVVKFGGSSLADAGQIQKAAAIIKAEADRRYVVPSAPGKRFKDDIKVTDMLYQCYALAEKGEAFATQLAAIKDRYVSILNGLSMPETLLDEEFVTIGENFRKRFGSDYAASRGEYLNGKLIAAYLGFAFVDAAEVIFFQEDGTLNREKTAQTMRERLTGLDYAVVPGFYGCGADGYVKTFSRGGSDVTGSIVAGAMKADLYENWTDVSGFLVADPRIVENPVGIRTITYTELRELSYMGASVLHEEAIFPVRSAGIPINIRNTNRPSAPGTMIVAHPAGFDTERVITGIAGKKGFSVLTIEKDLMNAEIGFGRKVLEVFEDNDLSFEHLPSGIDTMSLVISSAALEGRRDKLMQSVARAVHPDSVFIEDGLALVAVVGRGMIKAKGTAARVCDALARADVNIRMIDQGSSELNIIVGVDEDEYETAVAAIYGEFVRS